jgi:hypothetical protein
MAEEVPHYDVVIATPGNSFVPGYMNSILMTVYALERAGLSWFFLNEQSSHVAIAREATVAGKDNWSNGRVTQPRNGEFTYNKLFWIDSDIQWGAPDFGALYYSDKDIISGCYLMADRTTPIFMNVLSPMLNESDLLKYQEPFKAQGVGFGFLCVKSGVFEAMERPWFSFVGGAEEELGIKIILGEDIAWCVKARKAGFDIWVDPNVKVTHNKSGKVAW